MFKTKTIELVGSDELPAGQKRDCELLGIRYRRRTYPEQGKSATVSLSTYL